MARVLDMNTLAWSFVLALGRSLVHGPDSLADMEEVRTCPPGEHC